MHTLNGLPLIAAFINQGGWSSTSCGQLKTYAGIIGDAALGAKHAEPQGDGQTYLFVEGTYLSSIEGNTHILRMTLSNMKEMITPREHPEGNDEGRRVMDTFPNAGKIIMVGTVEFCQATAHYLALRSGRVASVWALHLIRKLTGLHSYDVLWMWGEKDGAPKFGKAHMDDIAKRTAVA